MKLNVSITGLNAVQKRLLSKANPAAIKKIVRLNMAELTQMAQKNAPVSTEKPNPGGAHGQLQRSITVSIEEDGMAGVVRAGTDYAEYVEKGTRYMKKQPYMRPAFDAQKPRTKENFKSGQELTRELFNLVLSYTWRGKNNRKFPCRVQPQRYKPAGYRC